MYSINVLHWNSFNVLEYPYLHSLIKFPTDKVYQWLLKHLKEKFETVHVYNHICT